MKTQVLNFIDIEEIPEMGRLGLTSERFVYRNEKASPELQTSQDIDSAILKAAIVTNAHIVGFSSLPNGYGLFQIMTVSEEEAANYEVGDKVLFHERSNHGGTLPTLVAIGREAKSTTISPGM